MRKFYWMVTFREGTETWRIFWIGLGRPCRPSARRSQPPTIQGHVLALTFTAWTRLFHWHSVKMDLTNHSLYKNWWDYRSVQLSRFSRYSDVCSCFFFFTLPYSWWWWWCRLTPRHPYTLHMFLQSLIFLFFFNFLSPHLTSSNNLSIWFDATLPHVYAYSCTVLTRLEVLFFLATIKTAMAHFMVTPSIASLPYR